LGEYFLGAADQFALALPVAPFPLAFLVEQLVVAGHPPLGSGLHQNARIHLGQGSRSAVASAVNVVEFEAGGRGNGAEAASGGRAAGLRQLGIEDGEMYAVETEQNDGSLLDAHLAKLVGLAFSILKR